MPRIIAENIPQHRFAPMADNLATKLSAALECPQEWISISLMSTVHFPRVGNQTMPVINVYWFPRAKETQDVAAAVIRDCMRGAGYNAMQIYFHQLDKEGFYEF